LNVSDFFLIFKQRVTLSG